MTIRPIGTRYKNNVLFERKMHQPYDYERFGLLNKIISHKIVNAKNTILKNVLKYYERSFIFAMKYVDKLKHFKNYNWVNR